MKMIFSRVGMKNGVCRVPGGKGEEVMEVMEV
jgi:hypothetical protein